MRRLFLFAIGLSALLWLAAGHTGSAPPEQFLTLTNDASCLLAGDSDDTPDPDQQWRAQHHAVASATESLWKSALVHAELAGTRSARVLEAAGPASSPDPPVRSTPHYLRHTPLLI